MAGRTINITLSDKEEAALVAFETRIDLEKMEEQKASYAEKVVPPRVQHCWDEGKPYQGAIAHGAGVLILPNSIACTLIAEYYDQREDITDYSLW